ncbi:hypothetical protein SUGI_0995620 [Cryptomeria japonica]|nr:hypothetical protein SUGI_0995620 [Cryptomeria japonica]
MATFFPFPLEVVEIEGVQRHSFWNRISKLAEMQRGKEWSGQLERQLGWVNISVYGWPIHATDTTDDTWEYADQNFLRKIIRGLKSFSQGIEGVIAPYYTNSYVIPFNGGLRGDVDNIRIHGDVCFVQVYSPNGFPMDFFQRLHEQAQSLYSSQYAKPPAHRAEDLKTFILQMMQDDHDWIRAYNYLFH